LDRRQQGSKKRDDGADHVVPRNVIEKWGSLFFTEQNPVSFSSGRHAKRSSRAFTLYLRQYHSEPQLRRIGIRAICFLPDLPVSFKRGKDKMITQSAVKSIPS
jgi:hypothetical protein